MEDHIATLMDIVKSVWSILIVIQMTMGIFALLNFLFASHASMVRIFCLMENALHVILHVRLVMGHMITIV